MRRHFLRVVLLLLLMDVLVFASNIYLARTESATIIVPDDFLTIQEAINSAVEGDTVFVKAGIYYEHVVVNKTVSLVGEDSSTTIVDGNGTGRVIDIISDNVNVTGFTVQKGGSIVLPDLDAGICVNSAKGCEISSNNIVDNGCFGIHLLGSDQNTVSGNNLTRNALFAIELSTSSNNIISSNIAVFNPQTGIGMHASSHNNTILGNIVMNSTYGISLNNVRDSTISGNHLANNSEIGIWMQSDAINNAICGNNMTDSRYCVKVEEQANSNTIWRNNIFNSKLVIDHFSISIENGSFNNSVFGNNIVTAWLGVHIYRSNNNSVSGNNITDTSGGIGIHGSSNHNYITGNNIANSTNGFILHDSDYNSIHGNNITACEIAIWLQDGTNYNSILRNNVVNNDYGIQLEYTNYNTFYHNNFIDNTFQTSIVGYSYGNLWDDGYPSGGNYWSDYSDADSASGPEQDQPESDGIGDTPYIIDVNNQDNYPLMQLYHGPVRNLNTGQSYSAIQRAINNATDGDRILALSGAYYENIVMNKAVSLIGENSSTTIIDGNTMGNVIHIIQNHVNITGFTIQRSGRTLFNAGIYLSSPWYCDISGNRIVNNLVGIYGSQKSTNISNNTITNNHVGIDIHSATYNIISRNRLMANNVSIHITNADSNNISENHIANNWRSITIGYSRSNRFHHNNFFNSTEPILILAGGYTNFWDNGLEGNYWDNYTSIDSNNDGIGDSWKEIDQDNVDHYPLIGIFSSFGASSGYQVYVISNSTIESFQHFEANSTITIYASNMTANQTHGFCRISIPHEVMSEPFNVTIDGTNPTYWNYTLYDDGKNRWIYFAYEHTTREIVIIPELPALITLPLFMIATLLGVIICRRKQST